MQNKRLGAKWASILVVFLSACGDESEKDAHSDVITTLLPCNDVTQFGNGDLCLSPDGNPDLGLCGQSNDVVCTLGRLCFDSPATRSCQCDTDSDCQGFTAYVNESRAALGQSTLSPQCVEGACVGDVDPIVDADDTVGGGG